MAKPRSKRRSIVGAMVGEEDRLDKLEVEVTEQTAPKPEVPAGKGASVEAEVAEVDPPVEEGPGAAEEHEHSPGEQSRGEGSACPKCGTATSPLETSLPLPDSRNPDRDNPDAAEEKGAPRQKRLERLMVRMTPEDREDWKLLAEAERLTESSLAYMAIREYMSQRRHLVESAKTFRSALRKTG